MLTGMDQVIQVKEKAGYVINQFEKRGEKIELLDSKAGIITAKCSTNAWSYNNTYMAGYPGLALKAKGHLKVIMTASLGLDSISSLH